MPVSKPRVRLVVLNYNGGEMTLRCLDHLQRLDWPPERLHIVLVDNASTDGVVATLRANGAAGRTPAVRVIESGGNLGFPANNLGLAVADEAGIDYVGLVNNDAFVEPDWLDPLVAALDEDPGLGAACPKILFEPRFRSVRLQTPTFAPGRGDPRQLGIQVLGVRVDGVDRWNGAQAVGGCHPMEVSADGPFHWTSDRADIRVPLPAGRDDPRVELRLRAPQGPVRAAADTEAGAGGEVPLHVGPEPAWYEVPLTGEPFDVINNIGSVVLADGHSADRGYLEVDDGRYDQPTDVFAWCGAGVLLRPEYLAQVGLLEERFFMYYEDTDLSWRGRAAGWRYRYVPSAVMRHVHAASSVEGSPLFAHNVERNRLLMLVRNAPAGMATRQALLHLRATASYARRDMLGPLLRRRRPSGVTVRRRLRAELAFVASLGWAVRSRRAIRRRQVVPDADLLAELLPNP
jgi:GT2 family glycosyltransferase